MRNLAEYIMRGRKQAILIALLCAILPMLGWVAVVIMALVTLRKGAKEGAIILAWIILPGLVVALKGFPLLFFYDVVGGSVATYGMAVLLRQTASWAKTLEVAAVIGLIGVVLVHLVFPDINLWWHQQLLSYLVGLSKHFGWQSSPQELQLLATKISNIATGLQLSLLLFGNAFNLAIARWFQAQLYNPQGFRPEILNIRLGKPAVIVLLLAALGCIAGSATALDAICLIIMPFFIAGLSLLHGVVELAKLSRVWLIIFYILLVLFFVYLVIIVAAFALADSWLNFRQRLVIKNQ